MPSTTMSFLAAKPIDSTPVIDTASGDSGHAQTKKISAYYSLVFPSFTFYVQTLSITIGRRCAFNSHSTPSSSSGGAPDKGHVDVDLGNLKSVSRLHAKIEYDRDEDRFVLVVISRNGAWVDGVWSGSGSRAPLGERSQIQISSRIFHFILPPPSPPEDTPSPSSQSSHNRARSPSVDITSISPPSSLPPQSPRPVELVEVKPPPPEPQLPSTNSLKPSKQPASKKRKKEKAEPSTPFIPPLPEKPRPAVLPPKPPLTYSQLIYRAIKALDGKATLQQINRWIKSEFDYYRWTDNNAWESSVRHNLSSGAAFKKMERCGGDKGKGFYWSLDEVLVHILEEQEVKSSVSAIGPQAEGRTKGPSLPPPLTSTPLSMKVQTTTYKPQLHLPTSANVTSGYSGTPISAPNPYAILTQGPWQAQRRSGITLTDKIAISPSPLQVVPQPPKTTSAAHPKSAGASVTVPRLSTASTPSAAAAVSATSAVFTGPLIPDITIPIIVGPIPPTHPDYAPTHPNNSARKGYMILHEKKIILDPDVFSGLSQDSLLQMQKMGARQALEKLKDHMVKTLKERRAKGRKLAKGKGKTGKGVTGVKKSTFITPATDAMAVDSVAQTHPRASSPIVVVDDSEEEGPASKKRKMSVTLPAVPSVSVM